MKKDEIIIFLQQLVESLKQQLDSKDERIDELLRQVTSLTNEVASLNALLVQKGEEEKKTQRALKVLGKLNCNKSEKQSAQAQKEATPEESKGAEPGEKQGKKERPHTNNGAKRKVYYDLETVTKDVYPDDPAFDSQAASYIGYDEVVRYELIPMKFRKTIYHIHKYSQGGKLMEGKTPVAPFLNSNYDGSFIAGISHLRFDCGDDFDCKVIVRLINYIYHLDHKHKIGQDGWTETKHRKWRKDMCKPIMKIIRKKLDRMAADKTILPKTEKYDAVHYMFGEWDALMNIFKRGDYHLDNNAIERLNRYVSLSRRNSLFFGSHKGAERGAMFYSLICSCRLNGVNFFEYISDVINKAAALPPNTPLEKYRMLLPDKWKENR